MPLKSLFFFALVMLLVGCENEKQSRVENPNKLSEQVYQKVEILPFYLDLLHFKSAKNKPEAFLNLSNKNGDFFNFYLNNLLKITDIKNPNAINDLMQFLDNEFIDTLFRESASNFAEFENFELSYSDAFGKIKSYFPAFTVPKIQLVVSGFRIANGLTDSSIMVGLDMYLGKDFRYYPKVDFIMEYQRKRLDPVYMVPHGIKLIADDMVGDPKPNANLIEMIIHSGKSLYLLEQFLPNLHDTLLTDYTTEQLNWCKNSEGSIWAYLVDNDLLYKQDAYAVRKWFNDAPFTNGLPNESPGKLGYWVGWQIVKSFMQNRKDLGPIDLLKISDYASILEQAKYKPKAGLK